ncbi:MAG TPA: hypothetical protein VFZ65_16630 [Planctomycetota bacterium]|nr:hypothetical protein [Planctomycetota bacterium]
MRRTSHPLFVAAATVSTLAAQDALHLAFVQADQAPAAARSAAFVSFLGRRFASVKQIAAADLNASTLEGIDVVLLDWSQGDGVMKWMNDAKAEITCPLGERAAWHVPTVLLGSAGLNLAVAWDVRGGSG